MNPKSAHRGLLDEARRLIAEVYEEALTKARDPGYRADPEADDIYARYNAFDALIAQHEQLRGHSLGWISAAFQPSRGAGATRTAETGEFALVDADEMELTVDRARYVQKAEDAHSQALAELEMRLHELNLMLATALDEEAMHPRSLYRAFEDALGELDADVRSKRIVYRLFHECLAPRLGSFYEHANGVLREAGLLPTEEDIRAALRARQAASAGGHAVPSPAQVPPTPESAWTQIAGGVAGAGLNPVDMAVLQQYLAGAAGPPASGAAGRPHGQMAVGAPASGAASPLLAVLGTLQRAQVGVEAAAALTPETLQREILNALGGGDGAGQAQLSELEERTLDLVNRIFQEIHGRAELIDAVKAQLARVQIPIIKLALLEPGLFMEPAHPARRLINELVRVGIGIDAPEDPLLQRLHSLIDRLLEEFDTDSEPFRRALQALMEWEIREREQADRAEAELRLRAEQEAVRARAKQRVVGTIRHYLRDRQVPDEAMQFILKVWAPYMGWVLLNEGQGSDSWREAVHVLRQIVEATQPDRSWEEVRAMVGEDARLLGELEAHLRHSPLMEPERRQLLHVLRDWFRALLHRRAPTGDASDEMSVPPLEAVLPEEEVPPEEPPAPMREIPPEVRPGAWFRLYMGKDHIPRRLKLLSVLEPTGKVLFADRLGEGPLEVDLDTFLDDLDAGRTRLIDEAGAFDRALSHVIRNIRDTLDARAV